MGLNISLYKVIDVTSHHFEEDNRFDYIRYSGDVEFNGYLGEHGIYISCRRSFCCDWVFTRPADFEQTRQWIKAYILEENQERLLQALDWMQQDTSLWFYFGW